MQSIPIHYNAQEISHKWYHYWLEKDFFSAYSSSTKTPYTIIMPPPNITGVLHMGHVLNHTIQDVLIRRARMQGKEACWVPGIDHASIATEAKVVAMLQAQGIQKKDLTREKFLEHAWAWKEKYGNIILEQIKKLGASCDWKRLCFTMDSAPSAAVKKVFIELYEQGHIYRGKRMIHWDPIGKTALADDEVVYKSVANQLYYISYQIAGQPESIIIATTRPETLLGDTAICVHPQDIRYQDLIGKTAIVPLCKREVPIIADEYVDQTLGTGCLKVTPAHDINDYTLAQKHHLPIIDIFNDDGSLSPSANFYVGEDRFVAREKIVAQLAKENKLVKVTPFTSNIGFSERTNAVVEPKLSSQWFLRMPKLSAPALATVLEGKVNFYPAKFIHMYQSWLTHIQDWCISRQLWWGHQIPAFYLPDGTIIVALSQEEALEKAKKNPLYQSLTIKDLRHEEDVLDTWFSAWLWPINVFNGINQPTDNPDFAYFYPTDSLVTAPEIIFFWVARMIMAGNTFTKQSPFKHVYFTGIVRDKAGKKMSKSLGNSPDPIALIDQYGADGVRVGMLLSTSAGNDLLFDVKLCEQGRNFANKIWNAFRLIKSWEKQTSSSATDSQQHVVTWFESQLQATIEEVNTNFEQFRISDALMSVYKLVWDYFCPWYLEMVKPERGACIDHAIYLTTIRFFECILKLLHPFMPFVTEEIWHLISVREEVDCIIVAPWPVIFQPMEKAPILAEAQLAFDLISEIRNLRSKYQIPIKESVTLYHEDSNHMPTFVKRFDGYIKKMAGVQTISTVEPQHASQFSHFQVGTFAFTLGYQKTIPISHEIEKLRTEKVYYQNFLQQILKKLNNQQFINNAPDHVIAIENKKKADTEQKIANIALQLSLLEKDSTH